MTTDGCREWRERLGAYALGQLPSDERAALEAHLEGCADCRAEVDVADAAGRTAAAGRPGPLRRRAPPPPAELGDRIATRIGARAAAPPRRGAAAASASASAPPRPPRPPPCCWRSSSSAAAAGSNSWPEQPVSLPLAAARSRRSPRRWSRAPSAPRSTCTSAASARAPSAGSSCAGPTAAGSPPAPSATARATDATPPCSARRSTSRPHRAVGVRAGDRTFVAPLHHGVGADGIVEPENDREGVQLMRATTAGPRRRAGIAALALAVSPRHAEAAATQQQQLQQRGGGAYGGGGDSTEGGRRLQAAAARRDRGRHQPEAGQDPGRLEGLHPLRLPQGQGRRRRPATGPARRSGRRYHDRGRAAGRARAPRPRSWARPSAATGPPQVTYAGQPLYTYAGDKKPGDANGNDFKPFGAQWYALTPAASSAGVLSL